MTLDCTIDGKVLSLSVNSSKPLLQILSEDVDNTTLTSNCHGNGCGNCLVLVNGYAVLSCMVPAFRLKDAVIQTFESFSKTRQYRDIERAYQATGNRPCPNCYASRTLLIESILQSLTGAHHPDNEKPLPHGGVIGEKDLDEKAIVKELSLNTCQCMDTGELLQIVELALSYRSRKNVVRRA
ncbi:MAG: ferredoxin [Sphaerochaetaceae bacterium]|nr:2Fe-2S iron-sulfur cluster-binding protein [Spirochaetales bacterium]MDY5499824.1 ferredoxin [Sphaerochaetaceae bacterium]